MRVRSRRPAAVAAATACLLVLVITVGPSAHAQEELTISASIDGQPLAGADANRPIRLAGDRVATVELVVNNRSTSEMFIRSVRLDSRVIGLTFFAYETRVDMRIGPGATDDRRYVLELVDLDNQAVGLLPARLMLLGDDREVLAVKEFSSDIKGSLGSIYGVFGLLMAGITAVLLGSAIARLAANRLSPNRWKRGTRFGAAGLALGLTLTFTLSALGIFLPSPGFWINIVLISIVVLFFVGFATPTPETRSRS